MSKTARDVMTPDPQFVETGATVLEAARKLADGDFGALPICGTDGRLKGMITDRDIVVQVVARGADPASIPVDEVATDDRSTVTIGADDSVEDALRTMAVHDVRRLPVIDGEKMVGIVAQADLAREADPERFSKTVEEISTSSPN